MIRPSPARAVGEVVLAAAARVDATILWAHPGASGRDERHGFRFSPQLVERRP